MHKEIILKLLSSLAKKVHFYDTQQQKLVTAAASRASLDSEQQVDTRQQRGGPMGVKRVREREGGV